MGTVPVGWEAEVGCGSEHPGLVENVTARGGVWNWRILRVPGKTFHGWGSENGIWAPGWSQRNDSNSVLIPHQTQLRVAPRATYFK